MSKPTIEQVIAEVRRLAVEYPSAFYVSPDSDLGGCYYDKGTVENGPADACGCIFGVAIRNLSPEIALSYDQIAINLLLQSDWKGESSKRQRLWCRRLQKSQDNGEPWGVALAEADAAYPPEQVAA